MCEQLQLLTETKYLASRQDWNFQTWKYQTQTFELCHLLASNSEIGIYVAPSIEISLDSNTDSFRKPGTGKTQICQDEDEYKCFSPAKLQ